MNSSFICWVPDRHRWAWEVFSGHTNLCNGKRECSSISFTASFAKLPYSYLGLSSQVGSPGVGRSTCNEAMPGVCANMSVWLNSWTCSLLRKNLDAGSCAVSPPG